MAELGTFLRFNNEQFSTLKNLQNHLIVIKRKWGIFQIIQPTGFTLQGAGHKKAMGQQKLDITVEQYYYIRHNKQLKPLHLPLYFSDMIINKCLNKQIRKYSIIK